MLEQNLYIGLVHHPIVDKRGETITTSVTNLDVHDIARTARTFGFSGYFIITPVELQQALIGRILGHWEGDHGTSYNPDRQSALSFSKVAASIEKAVSSIEEMHGKKPIVVVTGANFKEYSGDAKALRDFIAKEERPMLLLFGTGWGLHSSVLEKADFKLTPIFGSAKDGYNHLSVRSAVAIYCDRICR